MQPPSVQVESAYPREQLRKIGVQRLQKSTPVHGVESVLPVPLDSDVPRICLQPGPELQHHLLSAARGLHAILLPALEVGCPALAVLKTQRPEGCPPDHLAHRDWADARRELGDGRQHGGAEGVSHLTWHLTPRNQLQQRVDDAEGSVAGLTVAESKITQVLCEPA